MSSRSFLPGSAALAWLLAAAGLPAPASDADSGKSGARKPVFEEWVVVVLHGKTCGFGSTVTTKTDTPAGPRYLTAHQEEFVVKRLGTSLKIIETSKVTEDADGGVLAFDEVSDSGSVVESSGVREGDDMVVSSRGQTQRFHLPRLGALGPEAVRRLTLALPLQPGQPFSFDTFDPDYPQAIVVEKGTVADQEEREVRGVKRTLWKLTSEVSFMPGLLSTMWVDDQGTDVESLTVLPGLGNLHEYVTDRAECMKQPEGAEIFAASLIRPQRALPSPHDLAGRLPADSPRSRSDAHVVEPGRTARSFLRTGLVRSRGHRAPLHRRRRDVATASCRHAGVA